MRQEQADAEQLGEVCCTLGRKERSLMCWRKKEEELLSREKGRQWDGRLKRHVVWGRKVEGKPEMEASNSDRMD